MKRYKASYTRSTSIDRQIDIAWAAGFFEGEGTIGFYRGSVGLSVCQLDREPLERLVEIFDGKVYQTTQKNGKTIYNWNALGGHDRVVSVIMELIPHLSERRLSQAMDVLDRSADYMALKESLCGKKIHTRTSLNTRVDANSGKRRCLDCDSVRVVREGEGGRNE